MSLKQLAGEYLESAKPLQQRLHELREQLKDTDDPEEIFHLKHRMGMLTQMLTECLHIAEFCEHYYDSDYYIQGGLHRGRHYTQRQRKALGEAYANYGFGIDAHPGCHVTGGADRWTKEERHRERVANKPFDRLAKLCKG